MGKHRTSPRDGSHLNVSSLLRCALQIYLPLLLLVALSRSKLPAQNLAQPVSVTRKDMSTTHAPADNLRNEDKSQDDQKDQGQTKKKKRKIPDGLIIAPIPISSPAIGTGAVIVGGYIFPINRKAKVSPASTVGGAYFDTDNGTHGFALAGELFMSQDRYHITTIYVHGNLNYNFYGTGVEADAGGLRVPLRQTGQIFLGEFLRRLKWRFFVGPRVIAGSSTITLRTETAVAGAPIPPDVGLQTQLTGLGFRVNRDTRINRFYPDQGSYVDLTTMFFSESLGSKYDFEPFKFTVNRYQGLTTRQVLAYNLYTCATWGEPPFYGECIYGTNNQLRGYIGGKHIDRYMAATQADYRLTLPWRLGLVAFGGLGEVAPSVDQFRYRNLLPAGGVGVRLKLSKKYGVNLRADIAQGRDGHTFSMGIGEAF
jgi:hypothetical protein